MATYADRKVVEALSKTIAVNESLIAQAQQILTDSLVPGGFSDKETVARLLGLLDGPHQRAVAGVTKEALDLARDYMEKTE